MAPVCLFLAGKVEEQRRKVKDIAEICHMIRHKKRLSTDVQVHGVLVYTPIARDVTRNVRR